MKKNILLTLVPINRGVIYTEPVEHLGLCSLAAIIRKYKHNCYLLDGFFLGLSLDDYVEALMLKIGINNINILGISIMSEEFISNSIKVANLVKSVRKDILIVVGGIYPTMKPDELMQSCSAIDVILRGEADETICKFLNQADIKNHNLSIPGIVFRNKKSFKYGKFPFKPPIITKLPKPARDFAQLAVERTGKLSVSASRGCDHACSFCGIPGFSGKRRSRTINQIIDEISSLYHLFSPKLINFVDPSFIGSKISEKNNFKKLGKKLGELKLPIEFCFEVRSNQVSLNEFKIWKKAGLKTVHLGIESAWPNTLKLFNKNVTNKRNSIAIKKLNALGIDVSVSMIFYHPLTTLEEVIANILFLKEHKLFNNLQTIYNSLRMYEGVPLKYKWPNKKEPYLNPYEYFISEKTAAFFFRNYKTKNPSIYL